ncbi:MAG: hypothetical protein FWG39_00285 [Alphaproteobacteria bacterium]|nr:hypothetical protein [Alphaproteobacteria bacterium]
MGKFIKTQNSFAHGEVSAEFFARSDLAAANSGLSRLENMDVLPSGGISRRTGTVRLFDSAPDSILVPFSTSNDQNYLLVLSPKSIEVYQDGARLQTVVTPWSASELRSVQYAQRFGTMIFVHPNHCPKVLRKSAAGNFSLSDFVFTVNENASSNMPFIKFDDTAGVKLTVANYNQYGNNAAQLTASAAIWDESIVGTLLLFMDKQWLVTDYVSPTVVIAGTNGGYSLPPAPISDWREAAFSRARGWPASITFHQDRLVFGGSRDWPAGIWMSKVGDHMNFNAGTGLDDEAIFLTLLSGTRQQICTVASADNLQILTNAGEWAITAKPLTPANIDIKQHTNVGSKSDIYLQPQKIEGSTVFVSRGGRAIRELVLDDLNNTYSAVDLCALSSHMMTAPVDMAYHDAANRLFVPQADGGMAVLTKIAPLSISAWAAYRTAGKFKSVAVLDEQVYVVVQRDNGTFVERFDKDAETDSGEFEFAHTAASMPPFVSGHAPKKVRLAKLSARVLGTQSLFFSVGGKKLRAPLPFAADASDADVYSGDTAVNLFGTTTNAIDPLWTISGDEPGPVTVLSVTAEGRYSI